MSENDQANAEQIEYWNDQPGQKWVDFQDTLDAMLEGLGLAAIDAAAPAAGQRVLDVGCGCGATSFELGRRVGERGTVTGVDISEPMLGAARARAQADGVANVEFVGADAQTHPFDAASFDVAFSRFGVMFFDDPTAAFANIRRALTDSGRIGFICWKSVPENPWMAVPTLAAAAHVEIPIPEDPRAPGPFAFADADYLRSVLEGAGLAGVTIDDHRSKIVPKADAELADIVDFLTRLGPLSRILADVDDDTRARVTDAVTTALEPYYADRALAMDSATWIVTARAS